MPHQVKIQTSTCARVVQGELNVCGHIGYACEMFCLFRCGELTPEAYYSILDTPCMQLYSLILEDRTLHFRWSLSPVYAQNVALVGNLKAASSASCFLLPALRVHCVYVF